jgi:catechol 2,3-dioxygenase-like lactoylglutathione lyase family enzyme
MKSHELHHCAVAVADLEASINWYRDKLDFRIEKRFTLTDAKIEIVKLVSDAGVRLELLTQTDVIGAIREQDLMAPGSKHICFQTDDVEKTAIELRRRGVRITQGPKVILESNEKNLWIADNEGNLIEFIEELPVSK